MEGGRLIECLWKSVVLLKNKSIPLIIEWSGQAQTWMHISCHRTRQAK